MPVLRKVALGILACVTLLVALTPWGVYWLGLSNVDGRPVPTATPLTPDDEKLLDNYLHGKVSLTTKQLSPWTYAIALARRDPQSLHADVPWIIALAYNSHHLKDNRMIERHSSGAALIIWLTRNWTQEQMLATAAQIVKERQAALENPSHGGQPEPHYFP